MDAKEQSSASSTSSNDNPDKEQSKEQSKDADKAESEQPSATAQSSNAPDGKEEDESGDSALDFLAKHLMQRLGISLLQSHEKPEPVLDEFSLTGIASYIKSKKCENIIVMTGAGVSTSAGIPDFRSPETGLYHNLEKYNLPYPQSIFELSYFKENPEPFFLLAKELYPGNFKPTTSHYFLRLLAEKNILLRTFTQNIDGLELVAGLPADLVVAAHGTFHSAHCLDCNKEYPEEWEKVRVFKGEIPKCEDCNGIVKPDIVFFGESLPNRFFTLVNEDFMKCDLLIVMGTSLVVQPFANLIDRVSDKTPRLLINKEKAGEGGPFFGFDFSSEQRYRDVAHLVSCDDGCLELAELLGWKEDLLNLIKEGNKKFDNREKKESIQSPTPSASENPTK